ncbi:MAG TPA: hypothetical protein VGF61_07725 [Candidatus Acidoferrum sp.]|jgi:hypothetical protein
MQMTRYLVIRVFWDDHSGVLEKRRMIWSDELTSEQANFVADQNNQRAPHNKRPRHPNLVAANPDGGLFHPPDNYIAEQVR